MPRQALRDEAATLPKALLNRSDDSFITLRPM